MTELRQPELRRLADRVSAHGNLLIATDLDGTLAPIVSHPSGAKIPESTLDTLRKLGETGRVEIAVLSGRQLSDLRDRVDVPCILSGNHGLEISGRGLQFVHPLALDRVPLLAEAVEIMTATIAEWPGAWVEDKRLTATVHFRNVERMRQHHVAAAVRRALGRFGTNLGARAGKCSVELHPRVGWNKGNAVEYIRSHMGLANSPVLCLGDDATDETMFRALPGQATVGVGRWVRSSAEYYLADAHAVGDALHALLELLSATPAASLQQTA